MRKYCLNIHPNTFIWIRSRVVCVYNTDNGGLLKTPCCDELVHLVEEIQKIDNLSEDFKRSNHKRITGHEKILFKYTPEYFYLD